MKYNYTHYTLYNIHKKYYIIFQMNLTSHPGPLEHVSKVLLSINVREHVLQVSAHLHWTQTDFKRFRISVYKIAHICRVRLFKLAIEKHKSQSNFQKCECCRESSHRQRSITLTNCYDSDGGRLSGALGTMTVTVNEPMGCKCFSCS